MRMAAGVNAHRLRITPSVDNVGDTCSFNVVYTDDAKKEIKQLLESRHYYVGVDGRMNFSADTDVISLVLASMTGN
jgi:hypothetical protein